MDLGLALPIIANIEVKDQLKIAMKAEELGLVLFGLVII